MRRPALSRPCRSLAICLSVATVVGLSAAQSPPRSAPTSAQAVNAPPLPDVAAIGPQVGETIPAFSLVDQRGATQTLASLRGPSGLMLVFFRSADW